MPQEKTRSVFGPIPSRRLGLSLGIDLLLFKTCPLDCVYCECGATTDHTCERKAYFPTASVIAEIDAALAAHPKIDYLTFSGVGEPTLHSGIGEIIWHVKTNWPSVRVCLITNGVLLGDPELQRELAQIDLSMPSLDASTQAEYEKINRPAPGLTLESLVDAIVSFRRINPAPMWLEIFIIPGVNDFPESLARFTTLIRRISPDRVQLNSLDRPGVEKWVRVPSRERLEEIAEILAPAGVPVEIISRAKSAVKPGVPGLGAKLPDIASCNETILKTVRSRPCTAEDIAAALDCDRDLLEAHLRRMEKAGLLTSEPGARGTFYRPASPSGGGRS